MVNSNDKPQPLHKVMASSRGAKIYAAASGPKVTKKKEPPKPGAYTPVPPRTQPTDEKYDRNALVDPSIDSALASPPARPTVLLQPAPPIAAKTPALATTAAAQGTGTGTQRSTIMPQRNNMSSNGHNFITRLPQPSASNTTRLLGLGAGAGAGGLVQGLKSQNTLEETLARKEKIDELKHELQKQAPPGIRNMVNGCYMNAVLQVLFNLPPFTSDLLALADPIQQADLCQQGYWSVAGGVQAQDEDASSQPATAPPTLISMNSEAGQQGQGHGSTTKPWWLAHGIEKATETRRVRESTAKALPEANQSVARVISSLSVQYARAALDRCEHKGAVNVKVLKQVMHGVRWRGTFQQDAHEFFLTLVDQLGSEVLRAQASLGPSAGALPMPQPPPSPTATATTSTTPDTGSHDATTAAEPGLEAGTGAEPVPTGGGGTKTDTETADVSAEAVAEGIKGGPAGPPSRPVSPAPPPLPPLRIPLSAAQCPAARNLGGVLQHTYTCSQCQFESHVREGFSCLSLPVPHIEKDDPKPTLMDLIGIHFQDEEITRSCDKCKAEGAAHTVRHELLRVPRVLALHLKRFSVEPLESGEARYTKISTPVVLCPAAAHLTSHTSQVTTRGGTTRPGQHHPAALSRSDYHIDVGEHCMQEAVAHPLLVAHATAAKRAAAEGLVPPANQSGYHSDTPSPTAPQAAAPTNNPFARSPLGRGAAHGPIKDSGGSSGIAAMQAHGNSGASTSNTLTAPLGIQIPKLRAVIGAAPEEIVTTGASGKREEKKGAGRAESGGAGGQPRVAGTAARAGAPAAPTAAAPGAAVGTPVGSNGSGKRAASTPPGAAAKATANGEKAGELASAKKQKVMRSACVGSPAVGGGGMGHSSAGRGDGGAQSGVQGTGCSAADPMELDNEEDVEDPIEGSPEDRVHGKAHMSALNKIHARGEGVGAGHGAGGGGGANALQADKVWLDGSADLARAIELSKRALDDGGESDELQRAIALSLTAPELLNAGDGCPPTPPKPAAAAAAGVGRAAGAAAAPGGGSLGKHSMEGRGKIEPGSEETEDMGTFLKEMCAPNNIPNKLRTEVQEALRQLREEFCEDGAFADAHFLHDDRLAPVLEAFRHARHFDSEVGRWEDTMARLGFPSEEIWFNLGKHKPPPPPPTPAHSPAGDQAQERPGGGDVGAGQGSGGGGGGSTRKPAVMGLAGGAPGKARPPGSPAQGQAQGQGQGARQVRGTAGGAPQGGASSPAQGIEREKQGEDPLGGQQAKAASVTQAAVLGADDKAKALREREEDANNKLKLLASNLAAGGSDVDVDVGAEYVDIDVDCQQNVGEETLPGSALGGEAGAGGKAAHSIFARLKQWHEDGMALNRLTQLDDVSSSDSEGRGAGAAAGGGVQPKGQGKGEVKPQVRTKKTARRGGGLLAALNRGFAEDAFGFAEDDYDGMLAPVGNNVEDYMPSIINLVEEDEGEDELVQRAIQESLLTRPEWQGCQVDHDDQDVWMAAVGPHTDARHAGLAEAAAQQLPGSSELSDEEVLEMVGPAPEACAGGGGAAFRQQVFVVEDDEVHGLTGEAAVNQGEAGGQQPRAGQQQGAGGGEDELRGVATTRGRGKSRGGRHGRLAGMSASAGGGAVLAPSQAPVRVKADKAAPAPAAAPACAPRLSQLSQYRLHGVVCHAGATVHSGHYITLLRLPMPPAQGMGTSTGRCEGWQWWRCDDSTVEPEEASKALMEGARHGYLVFLINDPVR